jgi:ubiquinone/menaquinone biosynthesis C-methylase UbiE
MEESSEIPQMLRLEPDSSVLELGCGSGGYALYLANKVRCSVVGLDINASGVQNANHLALTSGLATRVRFVQCDASKGLPLNDKSFDAVFSNDVLCHIPGRLNLLCEMFRVLKPCGRMLYSDALIIGGMISNEEIATRSSIGYYMYTPLGHNERLIGQAGFRQACATDTTESAARIAKRWHESREKWKNDLVQLEGTSNFEGLQEFLSCVHTLTAEHRLLRYLYLAEKNPE